MQAIAQAYGIEPDLVVFLLGGLAIVLCMGLIAAASSASIESEIAKVEKSASAARALASAAATKAKEMDAFVEGQARAHFQRGRAAADREWTGE